MPLITETLKIYTFPEEVNMSSTVISVHEFSGLPKAKRFFTISETNVHKSSIPSPRRSHVSLKLSNTSTPMSEVRAPGMPRSRDNLVSTLGYNQNNIRNIIGRLAISIGIIPSTKSSDNLKPKRYAICQIIWKTIASPKLVIANITNGMTPKQANAKSWSAEFIFRKT